MIRFTNTCIFVLRRFSNVIFTIFKKSSKLSQLRTKIGWLDGCFKLIGPLRQYFSLHRAVSQREGEEKRIDR